MKLAQSSRSSFFLAPPSPLATDDVVVDVVMGKEVMLGVAFFTPLMEERPLAAPPIDEDGVVDDAVDVDADAFGFTVRLVQSTAFAAEFNDDDEVVLGLEADSVVFVDDALDVENIDPQSSSSGVA